MPRAAGVKEELRRFYTYCQFRSVYETWGVVLRVRKQSYNVLCSRVAFIIARPGWGNSIGVEELCSVTSEIPDHQKATAVTNMELQRACRLTDIVIEGLR